MQFQPATQGNGASPQLTLTDHSGSYHFATNNIIRLKANDNYTTVYFRGRRPFVVSKVLKIYDEILRPYGFIRTHRSHLINIQYIERIENKSVIMQDASIAEIGRRRVKYVLELLETNSGN